MQRACADAGASGDRIGAVGVLLLPPQVRSAVFPEGHADPRPLSALVGFHPMAWPDGWLMLALSRRSRPVPRPIPVLLLHIESGQCALPSTMRNDYYKEALQIVGDPYVLINMIWGRTRMRWRGNCPLIGSFEELSPEDVALREIIDGAITHVSGDMVIQGNTIRLENIVTRSDTSTSPSVDASCNAAAPT